MHYRTGLWNTALSKTTTPLSLSADQSSVSPACSGIDHVKPWLGYTSVFRVTGRDGSYEDRMFHSTGWLARQHGIPLL